MGAYLSEPVKEKASEEGGDPRFSYGASSMQGWRISQEDAHNCILSLSDDAKLSLFAVYDGHGGAEVAQYTAQHFPQHILKEKQSSSKSNFAEILEDAFLTFDQHLKQATVLHKLREMAGGGGKNPDQDADPKEARMLQKEASMPLEQILAKYVHHRANTLLKERRRADGEEVSDDDDDEGEEDDEDEDDDDENEDDNAEDDDDDDDDDDEDEEAEEGDEDDEKKAENEEVNGKDKEENGILVNGNHVSEEVAAEAEEEEADEKPSKKPKFEMEEFGIKGASKGGKGGKGKKTLLPRVPIEASPAIQAKTDSKAPKTESKLAKVDPAPLPMKMDLEQQMLNGHSENENNENKEREQTRINGETPAAAPTTAAATTTTTTTAAESKETPLVKSEKDAEKSESDEAGEKKEEEEEEKPSAGKSEKTADSTKEASDSAAVSVENGSTKKSEEEGANAECPSAGSSSSGGATASRRSRKAAPVRHVKLSEMNTEDDDSDDSEDDLEKKMIKDLQEPESDDSENGGDGGDDEDDEEDDDEDDEDENGEDDDEGDDDDDEDYADIQSSGEEPGFDSGCTACVSLMVGNELFVANVGDSRCVVSRGGEAVDMSFDHKPTDEVETNRITKAGGKVTEDGRVNGGLNLSRALGDHSYKTVTTLTDREQMISALPDVKSMVLTDKDEFMVIACDGIWNSLTSQEVIDFVKMRIDHEKELTLPQICEELFDHCLAPHTMGDGTGCDNMTCIIVRFDSLAAMSAKRSKDDSEKSEEAEETNEPAGKRQKLDESETSSA